MTGSIGFHAAFAGNRNHPPLIFLHGFMGNGADWEEIVPSFSDRFYCVAVDLPGHGKTVTRSGDAYRMEETAENFIAFLQGLGINRCNLIAYSMGGRLAFYLAATFPEVFEKVVIESGSPGLAGADDRADRVAHDQHMVRQLRRMDLEKFIRQWYRQPLFASLNRAGDRFRRLVGRRTAGNHVEGLCLSLEKMGTGTAPSVWHRLERITAEVLIIAGGKDLKFKEIAGRTARRCPRAAVQIIEDAGHNVHFENRDEFVKQAAWFLNE